MDIPAASFLDCRAVLRTIAPGVAATPGVPAAFAAAPPSGLPDHRGPDFIVVRWGGGARWRRSIDPRTTHEPLLTHEPAKRGVVFPRMEIARFEGLQISHDQGLLDLLTGVGIIKQEGGKVITHDRPASENFSLPETSIQTGDVDPILPLDGIAPKLIERFGAPRRSRPGPAAAGLAGRAIQT